MSAAERASRRSGDLRVQARHLLRPSLFGFLNGYLVLHPVAMVIFGVLEGSHTRQSGLSVGALAWAAALHSFHWRMLPMGLAFGLVGAAVGLVYGYQNRTIRLHRDNLGRQYRRLVELEQVKERTTHFLVHDFKTQLNCITGFADLLWESEEAVVGTANRDALLRIRRQGRSMLVLVNDLLDLARLEDTPTLRTEAASLSQLMAAVADGAAVAGRRGRIVVDPAVQSCPPVEVEPPLIYRVLLNLVANALQHNPPGTHVSLRAALAPDGQTVVVTCADNGTGIAPQRLATLFERFSTGHGASPESTGLGLAFARSAVEAHGGHIWCDSRPGHGARFHFTLPIHRSTEMTDPSHSRNRILVVEDEEDFAALMDSMLHGLGYDVAVAYSADEALAQVQAARPDVITLDIQMPEKSGVLFYRRLKSQEAWQDIPVIVVTGLRRADPEMDGIIRAFLEVDRLPKPQAYLDKPVTRDSLGRVLRAVLPQPASA
jgi:signal transduction histidine kinase/ActR/RegA family two-component response regulator